MIGAIPPVSVAQANISSNNVDVAQATKTSSEATKGSDNISIPASELVPAGSSNSSELTFSNLMTSLYNNMNNTPSEAASLSKSNEVDKIKSEMIPNYESVGTQSAQQNNDQIIETLNKNYDHAIFANMVAQVSNGIISTIGTLTKQA